MKENRILIVVALIVPVFIFYCDERIMTWVRYFHAAYPDIDRILRAADRVMYYAAHGTTMIAGALLFWLYARFFNRGFYAAGRSLLVGLVVSGLSVQIIKHLVGRARPRVTDSLVIIGPSIKGSYDSFPSGHSAMAFCLAAVLEHYYPKYRIAFYVFAVLEGLARIDGTSHFPGDVLAGALFGILTARLIQCVLERCSRPISCSDYMNLDKSDLH
ncbi:MAG TPA: phosphatase PAP2 family protein [Dissulfurispiraceae bacterium]|nr:phosphatase PAP2 family protein [Dissulfurispiraceae bacterium]